MIMLLFVTLAVTVSGVLFNPQQVWADTGPNDKQYISDEANIIDDDVESELNGKIKQFYKETSTKFLIFTVANAADFKISKSIIEDNRNTIVFVISSSGAAELKVGTNIEVFLPESKIQEILQDNFNEGTDGSDYTEAISNTAEAVMKEVKQHDENVKENNRQLIPLLVFMLILFIILWIA